MLKRRTLLAGLAAPAIVRAAEPLTIRFGFANVGVDNRQFSGGNALATAHARSIISRKNWLTGLMSGSNISSSRVPGRRLTRPSRMVSSTSPPKATCRRSLLGRTD
jgi:hypothetical protein